MLILPSFDAILGHHPVEIANPALVARIRRVAETFTAHEIAASLETAILEAADAAHLRAFEEAQYGEAFAETLVDAEYHEDMAAAWSLAAAEHGLADLRVLEAMQ